MKNIELKIAISSTILFVIAWIIETHNPNLSITLFLVVIIVGGFFKAKEGISETIANKALNVEILMILAAIGAIFLGDVNEAALLIVIFSLSGGLESYTTEKSHRELSKLIDLNPQTAYLVKGEERIEVKVETLKVGDLIEIKPGDRIPTDGTVTNGSTQIDNSSLTGEVFPINIKENDTILSGAINQTSIIHFRVDKLSTDSMLQKIIDIVENSKDEKPRTQVVLEKYEGMYVTIIILLAIIVWLATPLLFNIPLEVATYKALVILVVASPCAVMASIVPATIAAISTGAKNGILIKSGFKLEELSYVDAICFDKTGTITYGKPIVLEIVTIDKVKREEILGIVRGIEKNSNHPLAKSICNFIDTNNIEAKQVNDFKDDHGFGLSGIYNGTTYKIGKLEFVNEFINSIDKKELMRLKNENVTISYIANEKEIIGFITLKDEIREDFKVLQKYLKQVGIKTIMITGDNEQNAKSIALQLGIDEYYSNALPLEKVEIIQRAKEKYNSVAMIGDGINDAPALAIANVSIAMGYGSEIAIDTSDIILMKDEMNRVIHAIKSAKKLKKVMVQNLFFAGSIISLMLILNVVLEIQLPFAVIMHEGSTVLVILNGLRLLR